jgi:uncharacterized protein YprB with RNaseH-like and TPR domain
VKVLFFDTESTDLSASWGHILCASFVDLNGKVYTHRIDSKKFKTDEPADDSRLVPAIRDELESADIIVSWNGIRHDIPLLQARLAFAGERLYGEGRLAPPKHLDLMYYVSGRNGSGVGMKVGSQRLDTTAKFFGTENQKTPLDGVVWQRAAAGHKPSLNLIVEHCEADTLVLRDVFPKLAPQVKKMSFPLSQVWRYLAEI